MAVATLLMLQLLQINTPLPPLKVLCIWVVVPPTLVQLEGLSLLLRFVRKSQKLLGVANLWAAKSSDRKGSTL